MATTIKGGTLILDFKGYELVYDPATIQLKEDYFTRLTKAAGKSVKIINLFDSDGDLNGGVINATAINVSGVLATIGCHTNDNTHINLIIDLHNKAYLQQV